MNVLLLGTAEQQPLFYAIGLGIVIVAVGVVILAKHLESKYATKYHTKDFEKAYKESEENARRSALKKTEKKPEYTRVEAY